MNRKTGWIGMLMTGLLAVSLLLPTQAVAETVTVTGVVSDSYQLESTEGDIYDVDDTETGNKMLIHVGKKVKATGSIEGDDEVKTLTVDSFVLIEE